MQDRLRNAILSIRSRDLNPASTIKILAQDLLDIHDLLSELHEEHFGAISESEPEPEPIAEIDPEPASFGAELDLDTDSTNNDPPSISPF